MKATSRSHALLRACLLVVLAGISAGAVLTSAVAAARLPRPDVLDDRHHHGHFYPPHGSVVRVLPEGYRPYWYHGSQFYFAGGVWYAPGPAGFVVTRPPRGLIVTVLPPFYTTVWFAGVPYYYANDVYYRWVPESGGYEVVDPPSGQADNAPPADAPADVYIYPKNGQTAEQQSADRYLCYTWSKGQTGFDPTQPDGGVSPAAAAAKREEYRRAQSACLEARGYSVK